VTVIPDRIEAGTYIIAGALTGENLQVKNVIPQHIKSLTDVLEKMGAKIKIKSNSVVISKTDNLKPVDVVTMPYPGFPTDLQQPLTTLLATVEGESHIKETIYENRFRNVKYLNQLGANIKLDNENEITITGPANLVGSEVVSTDLRGGACLVLAGLVCKGTTRITSIEHIIRGYEHLTDKLSNINANIKML
jgi:UDP-N-acetylglucosamine 1-carboxyvinyltransferase